MGPQRVPRNRTHNFIWYLTLFTPLFKNARFIASRLEIQALSFFLCIIVDESDEVTIAQVAQMIADAFNLEQGIVLDTTKSDGQMKKTASNGKLRRYLPDFKFTLLKDAIHTTVDWFLKNNDGEFARK